MPDNQTISEYATWAGTRWVNAVLPGIDEILANNLVMAFGLGGESGEVAEVIDLWIESGVRNDDSLIKEMGDAMYYWSMIASRFGFDAGTLFARAGQATETTLSLSQMPRLALKLFTAQGRVLEVVKKYVRDGAINGPKLEQGMLMYINAWRTLCAAAGLDCQHIITTNMVKVDGRHARGTTRGSGDDR